MAFNAGGTNVGGMQEIEQGLLSLTLINTTLSVVEGETQNIDLNIINKCLEELNSYAVGG